MLKQTVSYVDFNDQPQEETLYFHLNKVELVEHLDLKDRFEEIIKTLQGPKRDLEPNEVRAILDIVKTFIELSYGRRSEDGKRFHKTAEIWDDFKSSAAYEEFLFSLFQDPQKGMTFLLGVLPQDLRQEAETLARSNQPDLFKEDAAVEGEKVTEDMRPAWVREDRDPTDEELRTMSREEMYDAMQRRFRNSQ